MKRWYAELALWYKAMVCPSRLAQIVRAVWHKSKISLHVSSFFNFVKKNKPQHN